MNNQIPNREDIEKWLDANIDYSRFALPPTHFEVRIDNAGLVSISVDVGTADEYREVERTFRACSEEFGQPGSFGFKIVKRQPSDEDDIITGEACVVCYEVSCEFNAK